MVKVYHGALHTLPPPQGTPEYERNSEKIFTWLKGKYPKPDDYDIDKVEFRSRTADDATEWALRQQEKSENEETLMEALPLAGAAMAAAPLAAPLVKKAAQMSPMGQAAKAVMGSDEESRKERADVDKYEYEQGKEAGEREDHAKGVKMALEALEMFKDELHVDGHPEDINVNELADAHDQLSRALHWLLDETDVEYIIGGRATERAEAQSQPEPRFDGPGMQWDNIEI